MLFHFLNCNQCVVCMFGYKKIYKVINLKSTPKADILFKKNHFSRTTTNSWFGLQSCFPVFVISPKKKFAYGNLNGLRVGRTLG